MVLHFCLNWHLLITDKIESRSISLLDFCIFFSVQCLSIWVAKFSAELTSYWFVVFTWSVWVTIIVKTQFHQFKNPSSIVL